MDARLHAGAETGEEEQHDSTWFERGVLAVIVLITVFAVVLPLLVWAAAIIFAGSKV